jgi:2'-5' RNA ligase
MHVMRRHATSGEQLIRANAFRTLRVVPNDDALIDHADNGTGQETLALRPRVMSRARCVSLVSGIPLWHGVQVAHAVEMYFDDQADAAVRKVWQLLADAGLPSLATWTHRRHRPHASLAVAESLAGADLAPLRSVLRAPQPTLQLYVLGTFPGYEGVLFLGVAVTADLLAFHREVHAALGGQAVQHWPHYLPGNWVPHCTLAEGLDKATAAHAFGLLYGYEPITATVSAVGIKDTVTGSIMLLTA